MLRSYFKVALRNIARHKSFSILNAFGLALGMSVSLLLISFYAYVSSFDDFHTQKKNIYRVISTLEKGLRRDDLASAPAALVEKLHNDTGIRKIIRINTTFSGEIVSDKVNLPLKGYYADEDFFSVFDFEMIQGNPLSALVRPNSIVLTEALARKITPSGELVGHVIEVDGIGDFEVTGIIKDQRRTHLWFEALISFSTLPSEVRGEESNPDQWTSFNDQYLYLLVDSSLDREKIQQSLDRISKEVNGQSKDAKVAFKLQALGDITPGPDLENSIGPDTDYTLIVVFGTICLLILLPACFNYANISIARALKRSKEIGLRKTMGGVNAQIFFQFITETVSITVIALAGAIIIFFLIRPGFEDMMPGSWLDLSLTWEMLGMFLLFAVAAGFLAGVFPALHFAGLNPIQALKGKSTSGGFSRSMRVRKVLIIFQFALSFCFIVLLIVFSRQYRYNLNFDYGFNTENILDVELQGVDPAVFKSEFSRLSSVQALSMSSGILGLSYSGTQVREQAGADSLEVFQLFVDPDYVGNMGLQLLAGRNFPNTPSQQEQHLLVNEEFLSDWQITSPIDAIGKTFMVDGKLLEVIGVLKNFHFASLQVPIKPFFLRNDPSQYTYANLKVASNDIHTAVAEMEGIWSKLNNSRKFEAHFFDDEMKWLYHFYWALLKLIGYLGLLAISISILGLLGMVIYTTETRTREVGIRKVFGASEANLTYLLSKDFVKLMLWATAFAIPVCFNLFDDILSTMQHYRVSINVWDIVVGLIIFFLVGMVTIASQIRKAAAANPIDTLRYE